MAKHQSIDVPPVAPRLTIGILATVVYGHYFGDLIAGVADAAEAAGCRVIAIQTSGVSASQLDHAAMYRAPRAGWDSVDAFIIVLQAVTDDYVAQIRATGKPVVIITQEELTDVPTVAIDNADGVRQAVDHLVTAHGHVDIGYAGHSGSADGTERYAAYVRAMRTHGLHPIDPIAQPLVQSSNDEQGYTGADTYLAGGPRVTAVVAGIDLHAMGFMRRLVEAGYELPRDMAVIGIDDIQEAAVHQPALSSVAIDFVETGALAFDLAARAARGEAVANGRHLVPERLVVRESCGCSSRVDVAAVLPATGGDAALEAFRRAVATAAGANGSRAVTDLSGRVVELVRGAVHDADPAADRFTVQALADELVQVCSRDQGVEHVTAGVRDLARSLAEEAQRAGAGAVAALVAVTMDLSVAVTAARNNKRMAEVVHLKRMLRKQYTIGASVLQDGPESLRTLAWLPRTEARAGCLGLWDDRTTRDAIRVTGAYDIDVPDRHWDSSPLPTESFPPAWILDRADSASTGLVFVIPVWFNDSDWGLLALSGTSEMRVALVQEMFRQWAVLMTVSLDYEELVRAVETQASALTVAYDLERSLLEEVRVSEERYALAADATNDGLWDWDVPTGTVYYSSRWKALVGCLDDEVADSPDEWFERVHEDDLVHLQHLLARQFDGGDTAMEFEHRLRAANGEYRWMLCRGRPVLDSQGEVRRVVGSLTDVNERRRVQDQLVQEAFYDDLTGLAKRALFMDRLNQAIELSRRRSNYWFAVLFIDLDRFKEVNDTLGHAAGDAVLCGVAERLRERLRSNDTAARLGGDEFAVLLNDVRDTTDLPRIVRRIQERLGASYPTAEGLATVSAAIGIAVSLTGYRTGAEMLQDADTAMYRAKALGNGRSVIFDADITTAIPDARS